MATTVSPERPAENAPTLASKLPVVRQFLNLRIGTKLAIGFGILVALTFLSAGVSYLGSHSAEGKIVRTDASRVPAALAASRAQADLLRMVSDVRGYLALGDESYRDSYYQSAQAFEADLGQLDRHASALGPLASFRLGQLKEAHEQWVELPERLFALRNDQLDREPAYRMLVITGTNEAGQVLIDINTMIEKQGQREPTIENLQRLQDMAQFQGSFAAILSALRGYVTTQNRMYRGEYEANLGVNNLAWARLSGKQAELSASQQTDLGSIALHRKAFLEMPADMFAILESERWREDLYIFQTEAVPLADDMQGYLDEMTSDQQSRLTNELSAGRRTLTTANWLILGGGIIALFIGLAMAVFSRATIARPIGRLTGVAEQIRGGDLEAQAHVESEDEIGVLAETFNNMTGQLRSTIVQVRKEKKRADDLLEVVIPIGVELTSEKNFNRLLEKMLLEAKEFCKAQAGTLYLKTDDGCLRFVIVRNDNLGLALGGTTGRTITLAPLPMTDPATGEPNGRSAVVRSALTGEPVNVADAAATTEFDFSGRDSQNLELSPYQVTSMLVLPLKTTQGQVLGILQLLNAQDPEGGRVVGFDANLEQMMQSFSTLATAALEAYMREQALQQQIQQLRIEIDDAKRQRQVEEITDTGFFADLQQKARRLRAQRAQQEGDKE